MLWVFVFLITFSVQLSKCLKDGFFSCFQCLDVYNILWSLPIAVPFFISRSAASTSHDVTSDILLGQCGLWYSVHCRIARCRIPLFVL